MTDRSVLGPYRPEEAAPPSGGSSLLEPYEPQLVNQTVAPKGGEPMQIDEMRARGFALVDQLTAMGNKEKAFDARRKYWRDDLSKPDPRLHGEGYGGAPGAGLIGGAMNAIDLGMKTLPAVGDLLTAPARNAAWRAGLLDEEHAGISGPFMKMAPGANEAMGLLTGKPAEEVGLDRAAIRKEYPTATTVGEVGTDVLSLITGKAGLSRPARVLEGRSALKMERFEKALAKAKDAGAVGSRASAKAITLPKSAAVTKVKVWLGRGAETAFEGGALGMLHSADPVEVAAVTGGLQLGLGAIEGAAKHKIVPKALRGGVFGFVLQVGVMGALIHTLSTALPGDQKTDRDYAASRSAAEKGITALILGTASSFLGGRARTGKHAQMRPHFTEAVTSMPRHMMTSFVVKMRDRSPEERALVMAKAKSLGQGEGLLDVTEEYLGRWKKAVEGGADTVIDFLLEN